MSDISLPATFPASQTLPSAAITVPRKFGTGAIIVWGAAGVAALFAYLALAILAYAAWGIRLDTNPVIYVLPLGHMAAAAVVVAALRSRGLPFRNYLALVPMRWRDVGRGVGYGVVGYLLLVVGFMVASLVQTALGHEGTAQPSLTFDLQHGKVLTLVALWILMVIAAPIAEELLFRGLLYRGMAESRIGVFGSIVVSSIVFGLVHYPGFGWSRVFATGLVGVLFVWLRWRNGNLGTCIVAHAVTNTIGASMLTVMILVQ
jgi:membrane protease YdiL (CAAX protease family)